MDTGMQGMLVGTYKNRNGMESIGVCISWLCSFTSYYFITLYFQLENSNCGLKTASRFYLLYRQATIIKAANKILCYFNGIQ